MTNSIPKQVRQNIFDGIEIEQTYYGGQLDDLEFLSRLYDLKSMKSYDNRFENAGGDIWQHCVNNEDWPENWVFSDERFELLTTSDEIFLRFLCETIHPIIRPDGYEAKALASHYNDQLLKCGWELIESEKIAGRAIYVPHRKNEFISQINRGFSAADILSSNWMQTEIGRIQDSVSSDPALAIGTAKDLVESCCKAILDDFGVTVSRNDDLPTLSKKMCKELGLVPEGIPSEAKGAEIIKRTLSNLTSVTKGIAELRGLYGSGHGRDGKHTGLEPHHARLAAACAIAFVDFATETYIKKKSAK